MTIREQAEESEHARGQMESSRMGYVRRKFTNPIWKSVPTELETETVVVHMTGAMRVWDWNHHLPLSGPSSELNMELLLGSDSFFPVIVERPREWGGG